MNPKRLHLQLSITFETTARLVNIPDKLEEFINKYIDNFTDPFTLEFEIYSDSNVTFFCLIKRSCHQLL